MTEVAFILEGESSMDFFWTVVNQIGSMIWGPATFIGLLGAGILFTLWTRVTQYRVMTHGIDVVRGVYDDPDDPGAINHFQALSAALSATVGLGNIAGVALAIGDDEEAAERGRAGALLTGRRPAVRCMCFSFSVRCVLISTAPLIKLHSRSRTRPRRRARSGARCTC